MPQARGENPENEGMSVTCHPTSLYVMTANQESWHPALTSLVTAIGEKFSAAFDR